MTKINSNHLTGLILTFNEEDNIARVLDKLTWLEKIIIIDSFSTDKTVEIINQYQNVEIHNRVFDSFAQQCNYGLSLIRSKWVLSLDADYVLTEEFINETINYISRINQTQVAYFANFEFLIYGKKLRSNNTTPRAVLFLLGSGIYFNDGHAHRLKITGDVGNYKGKILHDDRKSLSRWLKNQDGYSIKECAKLLDHYNPDNKSLLNLIRKTKIFAPFFVFFYCLFFKGLIFSGWAGWYYTLQRTMVEMLFSLRLIEKENFEN